MARKARQKISYVLPLADSAQGHRLGVNGLAIDTANAVLYSGGRDGVIYAWDTHLDLNTAATPSSSLSRSRSNSSPSHTSPSTVRHCVQAHTHWINDIALAHHDQALVSASSDITVKLWRPSAAYTSTPQTIGLHSDYVKVLAVPSSDSTWVASGGLDKRICLWDLSGAGQTMNIDVSNDEQMPLRPARDKGSVYALAATSSVIAAGGPESSLRLWDPRSGTSITKFIGHADNIRHILISQDGTSIVSASTDSTVRIWDLVAKRCLTTLTMHDTSVWSLFANDPHLRSFLSSDKSGLVAKTDTRIAGPADHPLSVALCQDHSGVSKLVAAGDHVWTATSRPTINRWTDINLTNAEPELPDSPRSQRYGSATSRTRMHSFSQPRTPTHYSKKLIPLKHILPLNAASSLFTSNPFDSAKSTSSLGKRATIVSQPLESRPSMVEPLRSQPDSVISGQNGLVKHVMLNDRRRVLTRDAVGQIVLWDLLQCRPVKSYGKRHLEDVATEINLQEYVDNWCSVDISIGALSVTLEEHTCFDGEAYYDEFDLPDKHLVKEDQRINLGKWVLRNLFANLVSEEQLRDRFHRHRLLDMYSGKNISRDRTPKAIQIPTGPAADWQVPLVSPTSPMSPSAMQHTRYPSTPGLGINMATPLLPLQVPPLPPIDGPPLSPHPNDNRSPGQGQTRKDYFSISDPLKSFTLNTRLENGPSSPSGHGDSKPTTPVDPPKSPLGEASDSPSRFSKRFRMNINSTMKKLGRGPSLDKERTETDVLPDTQDEKEEPVHEEPQTPAVVIAQVADHNMIEDNMYGTLQMMRLDYEDCLRQALQDMSPAQLTRPRQLRTLITPPEPPETPSIRIPADTTILIQEDRPEAGGVVDLFKGTVGTLAKNVEQIEKAAPRWLGDVLLRDEIPIKDTTKVTFVLEPWKQRLPIIASGENNRLNANRMLRAKKVMAYIAERIDQAVPLGVTDLTQNPEMYLELLCNDNLIPIRMTLATVRTRFWRGGGDVMIYYKLKDGVLSNASLETVQEF